MALREGRDAQYLFALTLLTTLLFIQGLRAFLASVYYENLVRLSINASVLYTLLLFTPALYLLRPPRGGWILVVAASLLGAFRIGMNLAWGSGLYLPLSGLTVAAYLMLLPSLLTAARAVAGGGWQLVGVGLALGFAADALLVLLGRSADLSSSPLGLLFVVPMVAFALLPAVALRQHWPPRVEARESRWSQRLAGLAFGAWLFLEYAILASPFHLARWNALPLAGLAAGSVLGLVVPVSGMALKRRPLAAPLRLAGLAVLGVATTIAFVDHLWVHSPFLPLSVALAQVTLVIALLHLLRILDAGTLRDQAAALTYASFVFLPLIFVSVFALTYGYIPLRGLWEGSEVVLTLGAAALVILPTLFFGARRRAPLLDRRLPRTIASYGAVLLILLPVGLIPAGPLPPPAAPTLRILTYNVHQGFNNAGVVDPELYLQVIRSSQADLVTLQESDTARLTSGNLDLVGHLARRLRYHAFYGPPTREQSFGIALLSRFPILDAAYVLLSGSIDKRALLMARVDTPGDALWVFVTHLALGVEDREVETGEILAIVTRVQGPVLLAGDFNSCPSGLCPGSPERPDNVYAAITAVYRDVWTEAGFARDDPAGHTYSAENPFERIDYVFASEDVGVLEVTRIRTTMARAASDHLPVLANVRLNP